MLNHDKSERRTDVCVVVVTYFPRPSLLENVQRLSVQSGLVVIVDNGSTDDAAEVLLRLQNTKVCLLRNEQNLGIAAALNRGIRHAIQSGYEWVATFDQDSTPEPDFFAKLLQAYGQIPDRSGVRILSPVHVTSTAEMQKSTTETPPREASEVTTVISSGSLIKACAFHEIGFFDESLFIDYVDFDFCLRLGKRGLKVMLAHDVFLVHHLGKLEHHRFFGFPLTIKSHKPWRRYYIMRNRFLMYRRHGFSFPRWALVDFVWLFLDLTKILLFEDSKVDKLRNVGKGIVHGFLGRTGWLVPPKL